MEDSNWSFKSIKKNRSKRCPSSDTEKSGPGPSSQSMKSDRSMGQPTHFKGENPFADPREYPESPRSQWSQTQLENIFMLLEKEIQTFVKKQLKKFHRAVAFDYPECLVSEEDEEQSSTEAFRKISLDFLKRMDQEQLAEHLQNMITEAICRSKLKSHLQQRFSCVFEGIAKEGKPTLLNQIYTELYITEGGAAGVNQEHEIRFIETASRKQAASETTITCEDIFKGTTHRQEPMRTELTEGKEPIRLRLKKIVGKLKPLKKALKGAHGSTRTELTEAQQPIRTVLTKGVAGIGKTVLTQKFSLDWAEGTANQDICLLFPFTFRELNMLRDRQFSLVGLLQHFFSEFAALCSFQHLQVVFIFDGLDECRLPLDFTQTRVLTEATESSSVDVLLVNLIRGTLLPSARLWITTRPAAANQIPAECISMVTEVRGFTDPQKEQYIRKRFIDEKQATDIVSHIKTSRSLHIICHIPVFCWIISTVLHYVMENSAIEKLPQTLTEMYIHFLVVQAKVKNFKYDGRSETDPHWTPETSEMVKSLGKLAFEQLQNGNLIFYESDLRECGLEPTAASVYSGVFTQVFREEPGLYQDKVYCFIHLSIQEFLAALHVHQTFFNSRVNLVSTQTSEGPESEADFYQSAVDQALQSPNGHLDLFLRFLLGLSLPTNQSLLQGLLSQTGSEQTNQETVKYIHIKLNQGVCEERSMNLFHCLNELNDSRLVQKIQCHMREGRLSDTHMSPAQWSAVNFLLLSSDLDEFDLNKYSPSENVLLNLLPVVKVCSKAILKGCNLSQSSCGPLASVLSSSSLTFLDLSNNDLHDSGVELLCSGLKSTSCRLETLWLSGCLISEEGGISLAKALGSAHSHLRELDLRYNHPGPSAELLTTLQEDPNCPLDTLRLEPAGERWMTPGPRKYFCELTLNANTAHRNLRLSDQGRTVTNVEEDQQYPDHKNRFDYWPQVLCSTGLTGRCFWEVDWSGEEGVDIAVSYRGIRRKGNIEDCSFGDNDQSWRLWIKNAQYSVGHNKTETQPFFHPSISQRVGVSSGRIGVFLDSEAGSLSFYHVLSDGELSHFHTLTYTFTQPLFPGFGVRSGSKVTLNAP